ncbi:MAG: phosphoadenosine phosphosulfate reductase family protein [Acutalibacteraceae bacterium]
MIKKNYYIASCSFGKDSIATLLIALENNEPINEVIFCEVMFSETISGEIPEHINFINNIAIPYFEAKGLKVTKLRAKKNYIDSFFHLNKKRNKLQGFPLAKKCKIKSELKIAPIKSYITKLKKIYNVIEYIGITADEPQRFSVLNANKISLLKKYGITQKQSREISEKKGLLSPVYKYTTRQGCWFCPNASIKEMARIKKNYANYWDALANLSKVNNTISSYFKYNLTFDEVEDQINRYLYFKEKEIFLF